MFNPKVSYPYLSNNIVQMRSDEFQKPFYFGGSQVPQDLELRAGSFSGSRIPLVKKGITSLINTKEDIFTTNKGDAMFHKKGHNIRKPIIPSQIRK